MLCVYMYYMYLYYILVSFFFFASRLYTAWRSASNLWLQQDLLAQYEVWSRHMKYYLNDWL